MPNYLRSCTDVICAGVLVLIIGVFVGLLIYGLVAGSPLSVISIYNGSQFRCDLDANFPFGYFPNGNSGSTNGAVCVASCPSVANQVTNCLADAVNCIGGTFTPVYTSFAIDSYCIPSSVADGVNIEVIFNFNSYEQWAYDLRQGWIVLLVAALAAIILSLLFFVFVRLCTGPIIWLSIIVAVLGMLAIGILFLLQAKGIIVSDFISQNLSNFSYDTLIIAGSCLIVGSVLLALLAICLRSRISLGAKAVELGSMFLLSNCYLVILPVTQGILIIGALAGLISGAVGLYSNGDFSFPNSSAFPSIALSPGQIAAVVIFLFVGLWAIFFFHGCNHFMMCSSVSVWYFNNVNGQAGSPCGDSIWRLARFHTGTVVFASLFNGFLFAIKLLANLFSFDTNQDDGCLVSCCLKCLNLVFCVFKIFLRYLNDGTYVQVAINGEGYCSSAGKAFNIIADNAIKVSVTDGISIFFTIIGVIAISIGVGVSAYFTVLKLPYFQTRVESPLIITFVSGAIAFLVSCVYLSMIDVAAGAVLQCYLVDHERGNGKIRYANERIREIMMYD